MSAPSDGIPSTGPMPSTPPLSAEKLRAKPPFLRFAFANPYNLSLLGGALAAAAATVNPLVAAVAIGAEALWLLHAPGSRLLQKTLWQTKLDEICEKLEAEELESKIAALDARDQRRVVELVQEEKKINMLASQNPSFAGDLLRDELVKSRQLVRSFIDMALNCTRYERYLASINMRELDRDRELWQSRIEEGTKGPHIEIARKNFDVIVKRLEKIREIHEYLVLARGQLDLMQNTFNLIADQIVTMQSPRQLSGQLDELMSGVESVRQAAIYTDGLMV